MTKHKDIQIQHRPTLARSERGPSLGISMTEHYQALERQRTQYEAQLTGMAAILELDLAYYAISYALRGFFEFWVGLHAVPENQRVEQFHAQLNARNVKGLDSDDKPAIDTVYDAIKDGSERFHRAWQIHRADVEGMPGHDAAVTSAIAQDYGWRTASITLVSEAILTGLADYKERGTLDRLQNELNRSDVDVYGRLRAIVRRIEDNPLRIGAPVDPLTKLMRRIRNDEQALLGNKWLKVGRAMIVRLRQIEAPSDLEREALRDLENRARQRKEFSDYIRTL